MKHTRNANRNKRAAIYADIEREAREEIQVSRTHRRAMLTRTTR